MNHSNDFNRLVANAKKNIKEVDVDQLNKQLEQAKEFILIDVRESDEWFSGHLPNAIHLPRGVIERDIESIIKDKETEIILYCGGGYRSALSCDNLQKMGFSNVYSLAGGIKAWLDANLPLSNE